MKTLILVVLLVLAGAVSAQDEIPAELASIPQGVCGNGICEPNDCIEDCMAAAGVTPELMQNETLPEQKEMGDGTVLEEPVPEKGFPWIWVGIGAVIIVIIVLIFLSRKKEAAIQPVQPAVVAQQPQLPPTPFESQQQLDAVVSYIQSARQQGFKDEQIKEALLKSGRTEQQVAYAFGEAKPKEAQPNSVV